MAQGAGLAVVRPPHEKNKGAHERSRAPRARDPLCVVQARRHDGGTGGLDLVQLAPTRCLAGGRRRLPPGPAHRREPTPDGGGRCVRCGASDGGRDGRRFLGGGARRLGRRGVAVVVQLAARPRGAEPFDVGAVVATVYVGDVKAPCVAVHAWKT